MAVDWVSVAAILIGPVVAVQVSEWLSGRRETRERKLKVFRTLMATRQANLLYQHVEALNLIDIEFSGKGSKESDVRSAWKAYHDHLNTKSKLGDNWGTRESSYL